MPETLFDSHAVDLGFAGVDALFQQWGFSAIMLAGYDCFLRSEEMFLLQVADVAFEQGKAILTLHKTKGLSRRLGTREKEVVVVESGIAVKYLRRACKDRNPSDPVVGMSAQQFRKVFEQIKVLFKVEHRLTPYSLRRGGASWYFLATNSMERTMLRGRWGSLGAAKVYVSESLSAAASLRLTQSQLKLISRFSAYL